MPIAQTVQHSKYLYINEDKHPFFRCSKKNIQILHIPITKNTILEMIKLPYFNIIKYYIHFPVEDPLQILLKHYVSLMKKQSFLQVFQISHFFIPRKSFNGFGRRWYGNTF